MSNIEGIEIKGGNTLGSPEDCAVVVSEWLTASQPNTVPKSPYELVAQIDDSLYATYDSHPVGHIAAHLQTKKFSLWVGGGGRVGMAYQDVDHFTIASFVVKPGMEGWGIGKTLLGTALSHIVEQLGSNEGNAGLPVAVISAMACEASLPLFEGHSFDVNHWGELNRDLQAVEPFVSMDLATKYVLGKSIVSLIV